MNLLYMINNSIGYNGHKDREAKLSRGRFAPFVDRNKYKIIKMFKMVNRE